MYLKLSIFILLASFSSSQIEIQSAQKYFHDPKLLFLQSNHLSYSPSLRYLTFRSARSAKWIKLLEPISTV